MATHVSPRWFDPAPFDSAARHEHTVAGARITYRTGGSGPGPRILFLHGGRAHATWWAPQVALFGDHTPKWAAMDLSGHGDSEWRSEYRAAQWLDEVAAVAAVLADDDELVLVGHSLGGMLAILLGARGSVPNVQRIISIDAAPLDPGTEFGQPETSSSASSYPSLAEGAAVFSSRRARANWPEWLAEFIGERSLRRNADSWAWRHDNSPRITERPTLAEFGALDVSRLTLVTGTASPYGRSIDAGGFVQRAGDQLRRVRIDAGHDVMMEQPQQFHAVLLDELAR